MQREMPMFGVMPAPQMVGDDLLGHCQSRLDAIRLCIQLSRLPQNEIADRLGIDKGHFSRMMQGRARFDERQVNKLMLLCGNYAPMQYEATSNGFALIPASQVAAIQHMTQAIAQMGRAAA
jgi:transcriptional regulator with XRE-family HTH domain